MLEIRHLRKSFGGNPVLRGIDLDIAGGELFALLGPSGCGKTTLLRVLAGFEQADSGTVSLDGARIDGHAPHKRACHMIFQRYALFPHLDVFRNVAFALELKGRPQAEIASRVAEALALVEMSGFERRSVATLSGGQQQRVAIARAVIDRPRYLLLDEPLSALDLKLRHRMQHELRHLQRQLGLTFIFVTHDQEEALSLADRVAVMDHGQVMQCASPRVLYEKPESEFVASFIGRVNRCAARVARAGEGEDILVEVEGLGLLPARRGSGLSASVGAKANLLVRPEHLQLHPQDGTGAASPHGIACNVRDAIFKGPYAEIALVPHARPDLQLIAWLPAHAARLPERDTTVRVQWPASGAVAFAEGGMAPSADEGEAL